MNWKINPSNYKKSYNKKKIQKTMTKYHEPLKQKQTKTHPKKLMKIVFEWTEIITENLFTKEGNRNVWSSRINRNISVNQWKFQLHILFDFPFFPARQTRTNYVCFCKILPSFLPSILASNPKAHALLDCRSFTMKVR